MSRPRCRRRPTSGFSTAEVLAGTALSLLAISSIYSVNQAQTKAMAAQTAYSESQTVTRTVIDLMTRELRMASYAPAGGLSTSPGPTCPGVKQGITEATPSKIHFKQDLNGDGALTGAAEDVVYDVLGNDLRRTDGTNLPLPIVSGVPVDGFTLKYFDGSNPPVELVPIGSPPALTSSQRDCVTKVRIDVKADVANPTLAAPLASLAECEVAIRNRSLANF